MTVTSMPPTQRGPAAPDDGTAAVEPLPSAPIR